MQYVHPSPQTAWHAWPSNASEHIISITHQLIRTRANIEWPAIVIWIHMILAYLVIVISGHICHCAEVDFCLRLQILILVTWLAFHWVRYRYLTASGRSPTHFLARSSNSKPRTEQPREEGLATLSVSSMSRPMTISI